MENQARVSGKEEPQVSGRLKENLQKNNDRITSVVSRLHDFVMRFYSEGLEEDSGNTSEAPQPRDYIDDMFTLTGSQSYSLEKLEYLVGHLEKFI